MSRTNVDFGQHELLIRHTPDLHIHYLKKPDTIAGAVKFINLIADNILVVTGDYGNWIFSRQFVPSEVDIALSDGYLMEKLCHNSDQSGSVFNTKVAQEEIKEMLDDKDNQYSPEEREWLEELSDAADDGESSFNAKAIEYPCSFPAECIPHGKTIHPWLEVIFDAFEEICRRIKADALREDRWQHVKIIPKTNGKYMVVRKEDVNTRNPIGDELSIENAVGCATLNDIAITNS